MIVLILGMRRIRSIHGPYATAVDAGFENSKVDGKTVAIIVNGLFKSIISFECDVRIGNLYVNKHFFW